ncbi:MAG: hypothetical protein ACI4OZ_09115 [Akkermansia sp.]
MNIIQKLTALLQLHTAIRQADRAHAVTGQRYYVLPLQAPKPKLIVIDRTAFRKLRTKGSASPHAKIRDLIQESFYFTPYIYGQCRLTPAQSRQKRLNYLAWYASVKKSPSSSTNH